MGMPCQSTIIDYTQAAEIEVIARISCFAFTVEQISAVTSPDV